MIQRLSFCVSAVAAAALIAAPPALAQAKRGQAALALAASPEAVGFSSERLKTLDSAMQKVVDDGRVVGMTTLLARHGKVVSFNTYGKRSMATGEPMTKDTIFRIYSMTKPITGVAMMILFEEGKWRLDDPVTRYIPEFKDLKVYKGKDDKGQPILEPVKRPPTMRELMSHTAGFGYGLGDQKEVDRMFRAQRVLASNGMAEMTTKVAGIPLLFEPGSDWSYSVAVDLQGYIVEKLSGQTLGQFMEQRIFKPLKMNDTAFIVAADKVSRFGPVYGLDPKTQKLVDAATAGNAQDFTKAPNFESGGGGLTSTTMDYARFAQMIANGGELDGVRILAPATVELMGTNQIPDKVFVNSNGSIGYGFNEAVGFGLDFMVVKDPRAAGTLQGKGTMSWGGAAGTWFWVDPTNDVIFVGMIQRYGGTGGPDLGGYARTLVYQALVEPEK